MDLLQALYASAANAGLLKECRWQPSDGSPSQTHQVGFSAPDDTVFDGLAATTDHQMSYPTSVFKGLAPRDTVEIDGVIYQVRSTRAVGDGSEMRAQLTKV
jgi:hypothetical protein